MFNNNTTIVRSNANAVMFRLSGANSNSASAIYFIQDVRTGTTTYSGTLNACKKAWNRNYRNTRQFVTRNGLNHRYMGA